jgi:DNA-binding response OmpR family regulator
MGADNPLVLLVSQDATTLHLIDDYLRFKGYEVAVIATPADLASHALARPPAAIILDLQPRDVQPRPDEQEHPAALLRANPHLSVMPIILLTPHEAPEPVISCPVDAVLKKPIRLQELAQLIGETITTNRLSQDPPEVLDSRQL